MAQHFYSAADAGFAALFTQLQLSGGKSAPTLSTFNGKQALNYGGNYNSAFFYLAGLGTQAASQILETTLLVAVNDDDATNNVGPAFLIQGTDPATAAYFSYRTYQDDGALLRCRNSSVSNLGSNYNFPVSPTLGNWVWMRLRQEPQGDGSVNLKLKVWNEADSEPTSWAIEVSDSAANRISTAGYIGFFIRDSTNSYIAATGVGIGEAAPLSAVGPIDLLPAVTIEQQGEVASNLSLAGTVPLSLSATIEQQARVRGFSNELENILAGIYNPGTEADGPLDWPYVYSPSQNKIVLQSGRFVGTTDMATINSYMEVPLSEIGTAPFTDYGVEAKTHSRAGTRYQGLRLGLTDSVSGAYTYVEVWDKNWWLEFYDGSSNGGADSGTLEFPVNDISLSYATSTGRFLLYINDGGVSNSLEQLGLSFDSAYYQVNSGGESVSWFEELATTVLPTAYSPATVYIPGSDSTIESTSEAQVSLRVDSGRRFVATVEQGSEQTASPSIKQALRLDSAIETGSSLLATSGSGLSLSCTAEQDSSLEATFGQNSVLASTLVQGSAVSAGIKLRLPLSLSSISLEQGSSLTAIAGQALPLASTIAQGSDFQSGLTLALPLAATVAQDSALLASPGFANGLPLSALSKTQSQVLSSATVALPLSSTLESGSDLPVALRLGAGLQATLSQASSLQAGLGLGLRLSTVAEQGTTVLGQMAAAVRLSGLLEQASSLEGNCRVGAGLGADVYTDSAVSAALGIGVRLSGTVDQPSAIIGGLAFSTATRLQSTITAPATLSATMTGSTIAALEATLEQGSDLTLSMTVAVPTGPSLLTQSSAMQVALKVSIPLEADAEQGSELAPALQTPLRLTTALMQESEVGAAELRTDKRFSTTIVTQTALVVALDAPHYAGEANASLEQDTELVAGLKVSLRFKSVLSQPQATLLAASKKTRALKIAPIQNAGLVRTILRVPALGSTGWLTVSDIFFHNDYYSEVVFEHVPASEITLVPALRIDTLSIMPA